MNEIFIDNPMNQILSLDIDEDDNVYFDISQTWNTSLEQSQINNEPFPIDPSLVTMTNLPTSSIPDQIIVIILEHLVEASSKILVYLIQILEVPEVLEEINEESIREMTFMMEELEALESIIEEVESPISSIIDNIFIDRNSRPKEIKDVIDFRCIDLYRKTYYLVRSIDGIYYWFHSSRADRDQQLRKLVGDYHHKIQLEARKKKTYGIKKLRSGRKIRI